MLVPRWRALARGGEQIAEDAGYTEATKQLEAFCGREMPTQVSAIAREHIEAYLDHLQDTRSPSTDGDALSLPATFLAWLD